MTKTVTSTGLVRIEYHGQVWFDIPGHTEIVFQRLIIYKEVIYDRTQQTADAVRKDLRRPRRDG